MKLTIRADGFEGWKERSLARARKLDRGERITPEKTLNFETPLQMFQVLTAERVRLCEMTRTQAFTMTGLANALGRDPKSVRRDVQKLEELGVLRTREEVNPGHGRLKIIECAAKKFRLLATF